MKAVFNSSPLIFLSKLMILDQAVSLFDEILIPEYVWKEISQKQDIAYEKLSNIMNYQNISLAQAKNKKMVQALCDKLGRGESEAIVVSIEYIYDVVVLDDNVARREALRNGINVKGTLGIIKRLRDNNMIQIDIDTLYHDLRKINFRVKRSIYDAILS